MSHNAMCFRSRKYIGNMRYLNMNESIAYTALAAAIVNLFWAHNLGIDQIFAPNVMLRWMMNRLSLLDSRKSVFRKSNTADSRHIESYHFRTTQLRIEISAHNLALRWQTIVQ